MQNIEEDDQENLRTPPPENQNKESYSIEETKSAENDARFKMDGARYQVSS